MKLYSPLDFPKADSWTTKSVHFTVPSGSGLRYEGIATYGVEATWTGNDQGDIKSPTAAVIRHYSSGTSKVFELEILPFEIRQAVQALPFGLPVFYLDFQEGTPSSLIKNGQCVKAEETLGTAAKIKLCAVMPDCIVRDPLHWADEMHKAFKSTGCDIADWEMFLNRIKAQIGPNAPVLLMDHRGAPLESGSFKVSSGNVSHTVTLQKGDRGNIQKRYQSTTGLSLWNRSVQPETPTPSFDFQLACLENQSGTAQEITITSEKRHILITDLQTWFAPQYAKLDNPPQSPLQRYSRGNKLTSLINGKEFFPDLFKALHQACGQGGGFHLAGWYMIPDRLLLLDRIPGATPEMRTLKKAIELVGTKDQVSCCFLPAKFITLKSNVFVELEARAVLFIINLLYCFKAMNLSVFRTDGSGAVVLALLALGELLKEYLKKTDYKDIEPNEDAVDQLHDPPRSICRWAPYPATIADNPLAKPGDFPIGFIGKTIERFNVYHQKLAVVRTTKGDYIGYCGGMDLNPNRWDDENHLNPQPYHDVHARVTGPATRDLATTFHQRWKLDGKGDPAFAPPDLKQLGMPGKTVVQVARTYFKTQDDTRKLKKFAPEGDRTILDTTLQAIKAAKHFIYIEDQYFTPPEEYQKALLAKVEKGEIEKLIVVVPALTDQPFGETYREKFMIKLLKADKKQIVQIGYPRRRYTVPRCDLRASSGKMILVKDLAESATKIFLGPTARIPAPPFWISVDGELIWVRDESTFALDPQEKKIMGVYKVDRGDDTCLLSGKTGEEKGSSLREHKAGAAATLVESSGINVHAKVMVVDDVFLSIGSANLNRRGFYSDGEANLFAVPETLHADPANPVRILRKRLWAEMMDLPYTLIEPLLDDPVNASELFRRSCFFGNRFVPYHALPKHLFGLTLRGSDSAASTVLNTILTLSTAIPFERLWDAVVDPSSGLQPIPSP